MLLARTPTPLTPTETAPEFIDLNGDGGISIFDFARFAGAFDSNIAFPVIAARGTLPENTASTAYGVGREQMEMEIPTSHLAQLLREWNQPQLHHRQTDCIEDRKC